MKREVNKTRKGKIKEVTWIHRKAAYHSGVQLCKIILFIIVCLERRSLEFQRLCSRYLLRGSRHFLMCCSQIRDPGATLSLLSRRLPSFLFLLTCPPRSLTTVHMLKKRESTSSPFVHRVLVPGVRNLLIFFAALAIAFGSWLETNDAIDDCSARTQISFLQVNMLRNISSNEVLPDTVSFGLWRHCFVYALNCTCTSHELTYTLGNASPPPQQQQTPPPLPFRRHSPTFSSPLSLVLDASLGLTHPLFL